MAAALHSSPAPGALALQGSLFGAIDPAVDHHAPTERIELDATSWVDVTRDALHGADALFTDIETAVDWRQIRRPMFDRMVDEPRLSRWYRRGEATLHPALDDLRTTVERRYRIRLGGAGLNYYRDGRDSVAFHGDRELRTLENTLVAIVTLGGRRPFLLRPSGGGRSIDLSPGSGDLVVMGGRCQLDWEHGIPKTAQADPRISISWRWATPGNDPRRRPHPLERDTSRR